MIAPSSMAEMFRPRALNSLSVASITAIVSTETRKLAQLPAKVRRDILVNLDWQPLPLAGVALAARVGDAVDSGTVDRLVKFCGKHGYLGDLALARLGSIKETARSLVADRWMATF